MKDLQVEVKKNVDIIEKKNADLQEKIDHMQLANESKFNHIMEALTALLQRQTPPPGSSYVGSNSLKPPFQVRSVKVDFPRFDGKMYEIGFLEQNNSLIIMKCLIMIV